MNLTEILDDAKETIGSKGVFGTPFEKNGVTIIPAARIMGGAGAGEGPTHRSEDEATEEGTGTGSTGSGGGFGVSGQPTGAFVIKGDKVTWLPAVDVNRLMFGFQVVMIVFLLAMRSIAKARSVASVAQAAIQPTAG
jgi:uncharacterized spore protein YtfJ